MKKKYFNKAVSLLLAVLLIFAAMPVTVFAAEESYPVIKAFTSVAGDFHAYKTQVVTVTILDYIDEAEYATCSPYAWDISASSTTGTVKAWMKVNNEETAAAGATRYDVYIGGNGGVAANAYSADLFWNFKNLKRINGLENFDTSNATNFAYMFNMCESLEALDLSSWDTSNATSFLWMFHSCYNLKELNLSGWDTSNVTTMNCMFKNCKAITELDISSFDTSNVTNMNSMFFNCIVLKDLYVGEGWDIENVTDGQMAFNCCDALPGFDPYNSEASIDFADKYVKPESEKPQPEKKTYTVTYEFTGEIIPDGVTAPEAVTYDDGTTVSVATNPSANGYVFSGWSTEDATVAEDGTFTLNNDVHFVGSWSKLYTVTYKYTDDSEKPAGIADLTGYTATYKAGETVKIKDALNDIGRYAFVGWNPEDIVPTDDGTIFVMPERDVVIYGLYKIPVDEVIIDHDHDEIILNHNGTEEEKTFELNVFVTPDDATFPEVIVESDNEDVVKVNREDDKITLEAVGDGNATITVYSKDDPDKRDTIDITVKTPVTDITASEDFEIYTTDEPQNVDASTNKDATNQKLIYESSDPDIAEVDEFGNVIPRNPGTVTITITSDDNATITETVEVTVKNPVTELNVPGKLEVEVDEPKEIGATVNEDATDKTLIYTSSNDDIVRVDSDGTIVGRNEGTATITVTSKDNPNLIETIEVTVVKYFNVTYEIIGEIKPENIEAPEGGRYLNGTEVTVEADLSADGYAFSGWSTDDIAITDGKFILDRDVHFVGSWSENFYTVEYKYEGDVPNNAPTYETKTYKEGTAVTVENNPSVDGYTFSGWDKNGTFEIHEDVVIKGTWSKIPEYTVTYIYEGDVPAGATLPETKSYRNGAKVTVENNPSVDGYVFSGWDKNGTFEIHENVVIKGTWSKIPEYTVTYIYEGDVPAGATLPETKSYRDGTKVTVENNPSVDGYTFSGWDKNGTFEIHEDVVIKGTWSKIPEYTVTYIYEGDVPAGATLPETKSYRDGTKVTVENNPSVDGYTFSGWDKNGTFEIHEDVVIKGTWSKIPEYTVTYIYEGDVPSGATLPETKSYRDGTKVTVENNPSVDGYTFSGWDKNGTFEIHEDVVIKGSWKKLYNVTYEYTGEIPAGANEQLPGNAQYTAGTPVTVAGLPKVEGYTFHGWTTTDASVKDNGFTMPAKDVVLKGYFTKDIKYYTVRYKYTGDVPTNAPALPQQATYEEGSLVNIAAAPSFIGYEFSGWTSTDANIKSGSFNIYNNVVIVGRWTMKSGAVTSIVVPDDFTMVLGEEAKLDAYVNGSAANQGIIYEIINGNSVEIDADGNVKAVGAGTTTVRIKAAANPDYIYGDVKITVYADSAYDTKHYIVFGRTEHIGWYSVSLDGGATFIPVFGNSHLEVEHGSEIIIKANDVLGDPFTFYINGTAVKPDENGYVRIVVDKYILVGALGIPVEAPDVEESLNLFQRFIKAIKDFFAKIANLFKF